MSDLSKIADNIQSISDQGGSVDDVKGYLAEEGMTPESWAANWRHYNVAGADVRSETAMGKAATWLRNFNSAVTLGWSDKAEALANAALNKAEGNTADLGDLYSHSHASIRQDLADLHAQHPVTAGAVSAADGAVPIIATLGAAAPEVAAAQAPGLLATTGRAAATGAGYGMAAGAGNAPAGSTPMEDLSITAAGA